MEIIVSNAIVGCLIIIAYTLGLKNTNKGTIAPKISKVAKNTFKTIIKSKAERIKEEADLEEARKLAITIANIENYNGDGLGQEEVK